MVGGGAMLCIMSQTKLSTHNFVPKELFYSQGEGFIEWRLKTMRQSAKRGSSKEQASLKTKKAKVLDTEDDEANPPPPTEVLEQVGVIQQGQKFEECCRNQHFVFTNNLQESSDSSFAFRSFVFRRIFVRIESHQISDTVQQNNNITMYTSIYIKKIILHLVCLNFSFCRIGDW